MKTKPLMATITSVGIDGTATKKTTTANEAARLFDHLSSLQHILYVQVRWQNGTVEGWQKPSEGGSTSIRVYRDKK